MFRHCSPLFLGVWICCIIIGVRASHDWKPSEIPNPQNDLLGKCQRKGMKSAVCDPDSILSMSERDEIDGMINFIAEGTNGFEVASCGSGFEGYQFAALVIEKMSGGYYRFQDKATRAKHFAKDIHTSWGVGDAACENGVMLFFSIEDKQMYVSTGKGTKRILNDAVVRDILTSLRPLMRKEEYGKAMLVGVQRMGEVLSGKLDPSELNAATGDGWFASLFGLIFFSFCCFGGQKRARRRMAKNRCLMRKKRTRPVRELHSPVGMSSMKTAFENGRKAIRAETARRARSAENLSMGATKMEMVRNAQANSVTTMTKEDSGCAVPTISTRTSLLIR